MNNNIIFYSYGNLIGLNISAVNTDQILGTPEILADDFLSATNISGTTYNIGLCKINPSEGGTEILKIPYKKSGYITLNMNVNADTDVRNLYLTFLTGIDEDWNEGIIIYPIPASDMLHIEGLKKEAIGQIYNVNGQVVQSSRIGIGNDEINVSELPAGLYILKVMSEDEVFVKRFTKE